MNEYLIIKQVIEHVVQNKLKGLSLDELAKSLKMSKGYLQKIFTTWVGISPKQFGRYLTLQYSKELLEKNKSTMQTSIQSGLSGTGRLYDLFVDIEAMTPGEYACHGADLKIDYSIFDSKFGICLVASTEKGICNILFADSKEDLQHDLQSRWKNAKLKHKSKPAHIEIKKYFKGIAPHSKIKLHVHGTNFQIKVWEALLLILEGNIGTYADIAAHVGNRKLSRAVGMAIGNNPIGYIIPCHRVLKSTGEISGYRWGVERKRVMLGYEAIQKNKE